MNDHLNKTLNALGLSELLPLFEGQDIDDSVTPDLSDADLKDIGIDKLGTRKRLLAAFGKSGGGAVAVSVVGESAAEASGGATSKTAAIPAVATKDSPWVNTLGMPFVPIPRFDTRFCIWPVRVQDYEAYCMTSGAKFPEVPFPQESDHAIVGVSWNDAIEFCVWLTGKERSQGKIDDKTVYRLPTDLEWSAAVGLPHEPEATPAERHLKAPGYPWGLRWPPPQEAGNYEQERIDQLGIRAAVEHIQVCYKEDGELWVNGQTVRDSYRVQEHLNQGLRAYEHWSRSWLPVDQFKHTSPVAAFCPNALGIFDLGGNACEWCMDFFDASQASGVLRGGCYSVSPLANTEGEWSSESEAHWDNSRSYRSSYRLMAPQSKVLKTETLVKHTPGVGSSAVMETHPISGFRVVVVSA